LPEVRSASQSLAAKLKPGKKFPPASVLVGTCAARSVSFRELSAFYYQLTINLASNQ
jgi:hypothetical protein